MGSAQSRGHQVDVGFGDIIPALGQPGQGPIHHLVLALKAANKGQLGQQGLIPQRLGQVFGQTGLEAPDFVVIGLGIVTKFDGQTRAQHGFGPQQMLECLNRVFWRVKKASIGPEGNLRAGVALTHLADHRQGLDRVAVGKRHVMNLRVFFNFDFDPGRQGVDHADANPVKTAGKLVAIAGKLSPRMQPGQD